MYIKNYRELNASQQHGKALQIIDAGLEAIETERVIENNVSINGDVLKIQKTKIFLAPYKRIYVIGFGKPASMMAASIENILGDWINGGIVISTKRVKLKRTNLVMGTHPMPCQKNIAATKEIVRLLKGLTKRDLVICLVSGGGSALLCYPNLPLKDYLNIVKKAFLSGIDITALNKVRKKYSYVKGGKLAKMTKASIISLVFSDVIGDDLATIASGPTYGAKNAKHFLLLNNKVALESMKQKAKLLGYNPLILTDKLEGEARDTGKRLLKQTRKFKSKDCFIFGGETTVTVLGKGKGGRCQELALGAVHEISKMKNTILAAIDTDGRDGPTDAAGAIVDSDTMAKSREAGLDHYEYLYHNHSYRFLKKMKLSIKTGITGINVADVGVIVRE